MEERDLGHLLHRAARAFRARLGAGLRDGWLAATPNPDDGRSRVVSLTARAREALPELARRASIAASEAASPLTPEDRGTPASLLARLTAPGTTDEERSL